MNQHDLSEALNRSTRTARGRTTVEVAITDGGPSLPSKIFTSSSLASPPMTTPRLFLGSLSCRQSFGTLGCHHGACAMLGR